MFDDHLIKCFDKNNGKILLYSKCQIKNYGILLKMFYIHRHESTYYTAMYNVSSGNGRDAGLFNHFRQSDGLFK